MDSEEFVLDTPTIRAFIGGVREAIAAAPSQEAACDSIRPDFAELLADQAWLPDEPAEAVPDPSGSAAGQSPPARKDEASGMGGGVGQAQEPFRSGYANVACAGELAPPELH